MKYVELLQENFTKSLRVKTRNLPQVIRNDLFFNIIHNDLKSKKLWQKKADNTKWNSFTY